MSKLNKYASGKIINGLTRADDISVSEETKTAVESIACANLAAGNTEEALVSFDMLRKFQTQKNIEGMLKMFAKSQAATNKLIEKLADKK